MNRDQGENPTAEAAFFLAAIVESSSDAIISLTPEGLITSWNRSAEQIFGYSRAEALGQPISMLIPPERAHKEREMLDRVRRGERVEPYETIRLRKGKDPIDIALTVSPIRDASGRVRGVSEISRDITRQKLAERGYQTEQLRSSVQRLQLLLEAARNLLETDDSGELLERSYDGLAAAFGFEFFFNFLAEPGTDRLRLKKSVGVPPSITAGLRTLGFGQGICGRVAQEQRPIVLEDVQGSSAPGLAMIRSLGVTAYACFPMMAAGRLLGTISFGTRRHRALTPDVVEVLRALVDMLAIATARKKAEQKLKATAAEFRLVFEAAPNGMVMVDEGGLITMANAQMERLFGYDRDEMVGRPIEMLIPARYRPSHPAQREMFFTSPQTRLMGHGRDLYGLRKDGTEFPVEVGLNPAETPEGKVVLAAVIDISRRRAAAQEIERAHEELDDYARNLEKKVSERTARLRATISELEAFSYSLAHDMRAPLRTIQSFSQVVLKEAGHKLEASETELLRRIHAAGARLEQLIRDVLTYSQVSREPVENTTIDLHGLVQQIVAERSEYQPPDAVVEIVGSLPSAIGHEASLTQCVTNLLDNAVKFVPPGTTPQVRVRGERVGSKVRLWFEDNGIGISPDAQERIFHIFERIHSEKTYPGTGIGLAIVRRAVERMNGKAGVESASDQGSRFWIELPAGDSK